MLPRSCRLNHRPAFDILYRCGSCYRSKFLTLRTLQLGHRALQEKRLPRALDATEPTRWAISISKKVSKQAVVRNRIRRRIRAQLWTYRPDVQPGWLALITVNRSSHPDRDPWLAHCAIAQLRAEIERLLVRADLLAHAAAPHDGPQPRQSSPR